MNKKFLSAILFGALMVTSTGTFVSCKDYDDDIDEINKELSDIKSQLSALQTKVDGGKYVTNVVKNGDGITVTWNDNSTSTIETIKGDKGDKGDVVEITIDPTTKNWLIDGEDTGVCAEGKNGAAATDGVSAKSPSIDPATGNWVVYAWDAEKKEYVGTDTGVSAKGASAYVTESSNYYILHVATSKTGAEYTEVKLPKSPVVITEIETLGFLYEAAWKEVVYTEWGWESFIPVAYKTGKADVEYNFSIVSPLNQSQKDWNAEAVTKKLAQGQALSTISNGNILVRIAPATVDASALSFTLVNSQLKEAPVVLGTPVAYNGLLARAANGNGLWRMPVSAKEGLTYSSEAQYENQFTVVNEWTEDGTSERKSIAFAFKEADGFATNYDLYFTRNTELPLTTTARKCYAVLNQPATVSFYRPSVVYDAHLHFKEADVIRWGIEYSGNGTTFTVTKMNDEQTIPNVPVTVHYVTLDGVVHTESVDITIRKDVPVTELAAHNILIKADPNKNKFEEPLTKMFNELGTTNTTLWKNDVDGCWVDIYRVKSGNELEDQNITNSVPGVSVTFDKPNNKLGEASKVIVSVGDVVLDRTKQYYAKVSFYTTSDGQQYKSLNEIIVPFTVSIPALTDLLVKEQVVFGGTANGTGVLNEYDWKAYRNATYSLKYAFNKLSDAFNGGTTINFAIAGTMKVNGNDVAVNGNLATVTNAGNGDVAVTLQDYANLKTPAYNAAINMVIASGASYLGKYPYTDAERNAAAFTLKIVSPIEQGTLIPAAGANATIKAVATEDGKAKITESDLVAKTYAGVQYNVFKSKFATTSGAATANGWVSPYIKDLDFESTNENVFKMDEIVVAKRDDKNVVTPGYVVVIPMNVAYEDAVPVEVTVSDVWGYAKKATINVKVVPSVD